MIVNFFHVLLVCHFRDSVAQCALHQCYGHIISLELVLHFLFIDFSLVLIKKSNYGLEQGWASFSHEGPDLEELLKARAAR